MPDFDERFYTYQLTDARTDSFASLGVRILVDPADPEDIKQVHALQDSITVTQPGGPGRFEDAELGPGEPEEGARRTSRAGRNPP